ncbi:hypothetical protein TWF694_009953 [Orbilia ellipsospora]|uniref:Uncharacterized protein n=1 Tax=Orbilia ellipsospora TaxID=2528407 RepID=A0AAV9XDR8_9PEZI
MLVPRLNTLAICVFALGLISFSLARTVITSETCTTKYCAHPIGGVSRTTRTIHTTGRYIITKTRTIVKARTTKTTTKTTTVHPTTTFTVSTVYFGTTIFTTTLHLETDITSFITITAHADITTKTVTPATRTVAAPSGFTAIADDPANDPKKFSPLPVWRRSAAPVAAPNAQSYPTAVTCIKTILTKTGTSDLWKTSTSAPLAVTKISWKTITGSTVQKVFTLSNARSITTTVLASRVIWTTVHFVDTTTTTAYSTTVTTAAATPLYYAACGPKNRIPPPEERSYSNAAGVGPTQDEINTGFVISMDNNENDYGCCVRCLTLPASQGKCLGSVYNYIGPWGDTCPFNNPDCDPPVFDNISRCFLILEGTPGVCSRHTYQLMSWTDTDPPVIISNGPSCARWKRKALSS